MATYWVFCLDGARVKHHLAFEADDDAEAMALMTLRQEDCDCEIWRDDRKVATMKRGDEPVPAPSSDQAPASGAVARSWLTRS